MPLESQRARYRRLADLLRQGIESGEYPAGSALPSEPALADRFRVPRPLVNQALRVLRAEGLVHVQRGIGTTVRALPVLRRDAELRQRIRGDGGARGAFDAEMTRAGLTARSQVTVSREVPPDDVARVLGLAAGERALVRRREMFADGQPVQLAASWLPLAVAAGTAIEADDPGAGGIYGVLAALGQAPEQFTESVRVRPPSPKEALFLMLEEDQRVISIRREARTAAGLAVEANVMIMAAHQWELVYRWSATG